MKKATTGMDIHTELRKIPALADLPTEEFETIAQSIYQDLEHRVGTALASGLTDTQIAEFTDLVTHEKAHPELAGLDLRTAWLINNHPNYEETVLNTITAVLAETTTRYTPQP